MKRADYDFKWIYEQRNQGESWAAIGMVYGRHRSNVQRAYNQWARGPGTVDPKFDTVTGRSENEPVEYADSVLLTEEDVSRITNLEDLLAFFKVDTKRWQVTHFRVNKWENFSNREGVTPLYQVRAVLGRNMEREAEIAARIYQDARTEMLLTSPVLPEPLKWWVEGNKLSDPEPCLLEVAAFDPHIGMYAWAQEVGADYDSSIAARGYESTVRQILQLSRFYQVDRILYVVGNDLAHVDSLGMDPRAGARGGATTAGTMQDFDSRLPKMFGAIRRVVVNGINLARQIAPVDVIIVPGNHDEQTMYRLGEVLAAWYRKDEGVDVWFDVESDDPARWPRRRQYYQYGQNALMFTHGTEYKRKREALPLTFATECPPEIWASTTHREVHTGHNHARFTGGYAPDADVSETRAIITRSLPGLTPIDAWHYNMSYQHAPASTGLVFRRSGGLAGLHEFTPEVVL